MPAELPFTPLVVLITVPSPEVGRQIARALLEQRLAACVNILPGVQSLYTWQGQLHEDGETLLLVKTRRELLESRLIPLVRGLHPYEVPEILALPVAGGLAEYLDWMKEGTAED